MTEARHQRTRTAWFCVLSLSRRAQCVETGGEWWPGAGGGIGVHCQRARRVLLGGWTCSKTGSWAIHKVTKTIELYTRNGGILRHVKHTTTKLLLLKEEKAKPSK